MSPVPTTLDPAYAPSIDPVDVSVLRHVPVQGRASERARLIASAARAHLASVGRDRFTTAPVARMAGVSIGTLYRYFPDRLALLDAISPNPARQVAEIEATLREVSGEDAINRIADILSQRTEYDVRDARQ